jgi:hypothetical protein
MVAQFVGLERRASRPGRDTVDHAPGTHDDIANAVAGTLTAKASAEMNITEEILRMASDPRWHAHARASGRVRAAEGGLFHISGRWPMTCARVFKGVIPMINTAGDDLQHALARRTAAESARDGARQVTGRARALLEEVIRQAENAVAADSRAERECIAEMRAAFRAGAMPTVSPPDKDAARAAAERATLDIRRAAGEAAIADLAEEEREAEATLERDNEAVAFAIRAVLKEEVEKITQSWEAVEAEARALRIRLGREGDPVWRIAGQSDAGCRATGQNFQDAEFDFQQRQIASGPWIEFSSALIHDADARLDFAALDRALEEISKERAERRAADERYIASLRGEAA